jgi:hypothetical protein
LYNDRHSKRRPQLKLSLKGLLTLNLNRKEMAMATTKKNTKGKRIKLNKLKVGKEKVLTAKDSKRIRGGVIPQKLPIYTKG